MYFYITINTNAKQIISTEMRKFSSYKEAIIETLARYTYTAVNTETLLEHTRLINVLHCDGLCLDHDFRRLSEQF